MKYTVFILRRQYNGRAALRHPRPEKERPCRDTPIRNSKNAF
jgi:hypothetical protein